MISLIVEDDFTNRRILQKFLQDYGEVHIAVSGIEAVEAFREARAAHRPYDLICLDILLPGLSGQEVLTEVRSEEDSDVIQTHRAKIVMVTGMDDKSSVLQAFREQCDAYLVKPVDVRLLREQLESLGLQPGMDHHTSSHAARS